MRKVLITIRVIVVCFALLIWYNVKRLSETDWRTEGKSSESSINRVTKRMMKIGCKTEGIRLMCDHPKHISGLFPSEKAGIMDLVVGSLIYSLLFVAGLWIASPLPDVTTNLFLIISFQERQQEAIEEGALIPIQVPPLQMMTLGGGEGTLRHDDDDDDEEIVD